MIDVDYIAFDIAKKKRYTRYVYHLSVHEDFEFVDRDPTRVLLVQNLF